jgi:hypothetical protein
MPAELSDAGEALMGMMPHYYSDDPAAQAIIDPLARELQRLEEFMNVVRKQWFPQHAADDYGQLGLREEQLGIPVEPYGVSLEQRRNIVAAYEKARLSGSGEDWIILLNIALGATVWEHQENDPGAYDLRITIPYAAESFTVGQVEALADAVTPAHLNLALQYDEGFIVGVSRLGDLM